MNTYYIALTVSSIVLPLTGDEESHGEDEEAVEDNDDEGEDTKNVLSLEEKRKKQRMDT